jgi:hypothetical protein
MVGANNYVLCICLLMNEPVIEQTIENKCNSIIYQTVQSFIIKTHFINNYITFHNI